MRAKMPTAKYISILAHVAVLSLYEVLLVTYSYDNQTIRHKNSDVLSVFGWY